MEKNNKKRITVEIAGNPLTLVTDESDYFVKNITDRLDARMTELTHNNLRISKLDAALLCSIDYLGEKMKADKRIRTLESQIALYEVNLKNLQDELDAAREELKRATAPAPEAHNGESISDQIKEATSPSSPEDKIRALEKYLENKKSADAGTIPVSREDKIKYIESLLRGGNEK